MPWAENFEHRIFSLNRKNRLLDYQDRVMVAVSGGPDSIALFHLLQAWQKRLNLTISALHVNHELRGSESEQDAIFVESLCEKLKIPFAIRQLNLKDIFQKNEGQSIQSVAREARYQAFTQAGLECQATKIALGHTSDDQAETVLMWMLRGAGSRGLSGMQDFRLPHFIRPLLRVRRSEILEYLRVKGYEYRIDSSNTQDKYFRNRIRKRLIPVLKEFNPSVIQVLSRQADILRDETQYLDQLAAKHLDSLKLVNNEKNSVGLNRSKFLALERPLQRKMVLLLFHEVTKEIKSPRFDFVENILGQISQGLYGVIDQSNYLEVTIGYKMVWFRSKKTSEAIDNFRNLSLFPFAFPGFLVWPLTGQTITGSFVSQMPHSLINDGSHAYFDADKFTFNIVIRQWRNGDSFCPFGMDGKKKKIQDFFSDIKLSRSQREKVPLIVCPDGILWVGGFRSDHRFRVTEQTKRIAFFKINSIVSVG